MSYGMTFLGWRAGAPEPELAESFSVLSRIRAFFIPDLRADLWFFKELFLTGLIVFAACKLFKKRYAAFIASMLFVLLFNCFGIVGKMQRFMMPIFWVGILLKTYYPFVCKHVNKVLIASAIVFAVCFYFYDYTYMIYLMDFPALINFQQSFAAGNLVFDVANIHISVFRSLIGIVGSIFFFALFQRCWKKNNITSFLSHCGQLTVGIYGIQSILLQRFMHNVLDFKNVSLWIYRFIITPSTSAFVFFISILLIKLIQRNNGLTFMLFGSSLVNRKVVHSKDQYQTDDRLHQGT
jgi:hypothetical protein